MTPEEKIKRLKEIATDLLYKYERAENSIIAMAGCDPKRVAKFGEEADAIQEEIEKM